MLDERHCRSHRGVAMDALALRVDIIMKVWAKTKEFFEGKFLVVRRDGTVPAWPHFVLGARDPCSSKALLAYAREAERIGLDLDYCKSVVELANDFDQCRRLIGNGDPDSGPHRKDDPWVIDAMRGRLPTMIEVRRDMNKDKS